LKPIEIGFAAALWLGDGVSCLTIF
jgi:hypothetical protein